MRRSIDAILFGSLGTLTETSDLQRRARNLALRELDVDWAWDWEGYRRMLTGPSAYEPLSPKPGRVGPSFDVEAAHAAERRHFARLAGHEGLALRDGVRDLIRAARARGVRLALCTTSDPEQVDIVLEGLAPVLDAEEFDWIGDATRVRDPKPAPAIYRAAMCALDVGPDRAVAVEDTPESAGAALSAGLPVVGFPGAVAAGRDFQPGVLVVDRLQSGLLAVAGQGSNPTGGVAAE